MAEATAIKMLRQVVIATGVVGVINKIYTIPKEVTADSARRLVLANKAEYVTAIQKQKEELPPPPAPTVDTGRTVQPDLTEDEKIEQVAEAIKLLNPEDKAHYTRAGKPDANVLSELVGFQVSAAMRDAAEKLVKG